MHFHVIGIISMSKCALLSFLTLFVIIHHTLSSEQADPSSSNGTFTFTDPQSFLRIEPQQWSLPNYREISFEFRTDRPHGLLLYHGLKHLPADDAPLYELYLTLEKGQLKVIHIYSKDGSEEMFSIGQGLNRNKWHKVVLMVQPRTGDIEIQVDHVTLTAVVSSLSARPYYGHEGLTPQSVLYFGGTDPENPIWFHQYNYVHFTGCIRNILFSELGASAKAEVAYLSTGVKEGCLDLCKVQDPCIHNGKCVNHFTHTSCDCFGTKHEHENCGYDNVTVVTLRGYSHITYKVYNWKDRVHSDVNRISLHFKTYKENATLLYGSGEHPQSNYLSAIIRNGRLEFEINFGDGRMLFEFEQLLTESTVPWHNFTVYHHGKNVVASLDKETIEQTIQGTHHHLHLDPELYIGGAPENDKDVDPHLKFVGCLKSVYFNDRNILLDLHKGDLRAEHHSMFPAEFGCSVVDIIPLTFPTPHATVAIDVPSPNDFDFTFEFKTTQQQAHLAHGQLKTANGLGMWQISAQNNSVIFTISLDLTKPTADFIIQAGKNANDGQWRGAQVVFDKTTKEVTLIADFNIKETKIFEPPIEFQSPFHIGANEGYNQGFVGCIRDIMMKGEYVDERDLLARNPNSKVTMDNCQLVDPCNNPQACEHGGKCSYVNDHIHCDCKGTGYTGKSCHFSLYKRTCEDLYLVGYRKSGVYQIDIDRNGPLPPAHVYCEMEREDNTIITQVINNIPPEMIIRQRGMGPFSFDVTYREFTPVMLQSLIHHSHRCYQHVKYECNRAPLRLRSYTWMESSYPGRYITSLGSSYDSRCACGDTKTCANPKMFCNCDIMDNMWRSDEANFTDPRDLGIKRVYVLQPEYMSHESEGRLTIGPLKCIETNTQQYVITFKTTHSYLKVPDWHIGDLAFSFRTSNKHAILLYQPPLHPGHGYFRVVLEDDHRIRFEYTVSGVNTSVTLMSPNRLNSGDWQQVWVDRDAHHMRFTVNLEEKMVDVNPNQEIGPFQGPMYVGGVPREYRKGDESGFIGCFRGLVTNEEVIDLHKYVPKSSTVIVSGCQPSCSPNPCKNGGKCQEFWGSYLCECKNPLAHKGTNCEINLNENAMTFVTPRSVFHKLFEENDFHDILTQDILLSFRTYQKQALLLYAFDHLHNFIQLHIDKGTDVVFTFNSVRSIIQQAVHIPEGISSGHPVQVHVDRGKEKTVLTVNGQSVVINAAINLVDKYQQDPWIEGKENELVYPPRPSVSTQPHRELFLGGANMFGTSTKLPGFVGCLQGLQIGQKAFDLQAEAESLTSLEGLVRPGCKMLCDAHPCHHGGLCIEDWINNKTSCDCLLTSYRGDNCRKDIGGNFDGKSLIMYKFTSEASASDFISVHLAFSTSSKTSPSRALVFIRYDKSSKYFLAAVTQDGGLFIEEYFGSSTVISKHITPKGGLADGYRHWFSYSRNQNDKPHIVIDGTTYPLLEKTESASLNSEDTTDAVVIGGTGTKDARFGDFANFVGCISNVFIKLGNLKIEPFEVAFGYQNGSLNNVVVEGTASQGRCADFAFQPSGETPVTASPPEVTAPEWKLEPPILVPYTVKSGRIQADLLRELSAGSARVAAIMGAMLIIVLIGVGIYVYKLDKSHKRQKFMEEVKFFAGGSSSRNSSMKSKPGVTFSSNNTYVEMKNTDDIPESHPLQHAPLLGDARKNSLSNNQHSGNKDPKYSPLDNNIREDAEDEADNALETTPLRSSQSQELEWDPAADNQKLISTAMNEMDPGGDAGLIEEDPIKTPIDKKIEPSTPFAPLATASEVTINNLHQ